MFLKNLNLLKEFKTSAQIFGIGVILGLIGASIVEVNAREFFKNLLEANQDIFEAAQAGNYFQLVLSIFKQNLTTVLIIIGVGVLHRYISLAIIFFNGLLLGIVALLAFSLGLSIIQILQMLLPHGIFEIPALLLAGAVALKLPSLGPGFKGRFLALLDCKSPLLIIVVLLVIAALIESYSIITLR